LSWPWARDRPPWAGEREAREMLDMGDLGALEGMDC
jgi:hypothetical protein